MSVTMTVANGHVQQSTLPLSRNYTETRDRLRARLQKRVMTLVYCL